MTTIVCALWLVAKPGRFSCNNQVLLATCSCPKYVKSVFNLIVDIHAMVNWQLSKKGLLTSVTWLYHGLKCTTHWGDVFFKVIHWPIFGFNYWSQAQVQYFSLSKKVSCGFNCQVSFQFNEHDLKWPLACWGWKLLLVFFILSLLRIVLKGDVIITY